MRVLNINIKMTFGLAGGKIILYTMGKYALKESEPGETQNGTIGSDKRKMQL